MLPLCYWNFRKEVELETHHLLTQYVYVGMKAAKQQFGSDVLSGKKVLVQGIGHVGENVSRLFDQEERSYYC
jgi:glutamate dehydrogenase/leucine dehydrogenase